ncbi:MAG: hypothetical protein JWO68_1107, partial [Actinomycetia bacterium]|nr:hypothetical protein [Actinomycetes bacterium]
MPSRARLVAGVLVAVTALTGLALPAAARPLAEGPASRYIVTLAPGADVDSVLAVASSKGATVRHAFRGQRRGGFTGRLTAGLARTLAADPRVAVVEPDAIISMAETQAAPPSWGLDRLDQRWHPLSGSYSYDDDGAGVRAYVVDSGINWDHVDFGGRIVPGYDIYNGGSDDCNGHGTHVASIVAGTTFGVAKAATIVPVRVLSCTGSGWIGDAINGINWAVADAQAAGAPAVINLSVGTGISASIDYAVENAVNAGITVVVAAGNNGGDACNYSPAHDPAVITVGSVDRYDARVGTSNSGSCVDLYAPGTNIVGASHTSTTGSVLKSGTSMAAPHVTGLVARYLSSHPTATPAEVDAALKAAATPDVISEVAGPTLLAHADAAEAPAEVAPSGPPPTPSLSVTYATPEQLDIAWNTPDGADLTRLYLNGAPYYVASSTSPTSIGASTTPGTTYTFTVAAWGRGGLSAQSTPVTVTPVWSPPPAPTQLAAAWYVDDGAMVWWASQATAKGYKVYVDGVLALAVGEGGAGGTLLTGLTAGTTHDVTVTAVNPAGESTPSAPLAVAVRPAAPTGITAAAGNGRATLTWTATTGATSYAVWRQVGTTSPVLAGTTAGTTFAVTGLTNGTTYELLLEATGPTGTSVRSAPVSVTPAAPPLAPPAGLSATAGDARVDLRWTASVGATSYDVYRDGTKVASTSGTTWAATGLANGTTYAFTVTAANLASTSAPSAAVSSLPRGLPAAPASVTATAAKLAATVAWTATSDG